VDYVLLHLHSAHRWVKRLLRLCGYRVSKTTFSQGNRVANTLSKLAKYASNVPSFPFIRHVHWQGSCCFETFFFISLSEPHSRPLQSSVTVSDEQVWNIEKTKASIIRVPTQFSKPNSMSFHDFSMTFSMTFPWYLLHFFHACLCDTYTCKLVTVLLKIADVALMGSNSPQLAPCVIAVSHLKTKPTLLSISTSYLHCQI